MDNKNNHIHAYQNDALADLDATGVAELIRTGQLSALEVAQAAIARAKQVNKLNAIQTDCFEQINAGSVFTLNRTFSGVPFFIKDNTDFQGLPTLQGSAAVHSPAATNNPALTEQFLDQGFWVLGKSKMPEFGLNASTEFKDGSATLNPWNTDYSCGASSGGSAALVASGVVPIAHANDGGGSIRIPAACCGLIGLKPSRGRLLDNDPVKALPINIISEGVLTRSVRDTANFYAGMEKSFYNPKLPRIGLVEGPSRCKLRIAVVPQSITGQVDAETSQTLTQTALLMQNLGHHVEEYQLPIPQSFVNDFSGYWGFLAFMLQKLGHQAFGKSFEPDQLDHLTVGLANLYRKNIYKTPLFLYRLKQIRQIYDAVFNQYDVILSPVLAHTTPEIGYLSPQLEFDELFDRLQNYVTFTPVQNVAGTPALSLPMGQTQNGLPIGMQFATRAGDEKTLLELAFAIEEAQPWRRIQD